MTEKKAVYIVTMKGRAIPKPDGSTPHEILHEIACQFNNEGSQWDRPSSLWIDGKCVIKSGLADLAWNFGRFCRKAEDDLDRAIDDWINQHLFVTEEK